MGTIEYHKHYGRQWIPQTLWTPFGTTNIMDTIGQHRHYRHQLIKEHHP